MSCTAWLYTHFINHPVTTLECREGYDLIATVKRFLLSLMPFFRIAVQERKMESAYADLKAQSDASNRNLAELQAKHNAEYKDAKEKNEKYYISV